MPIINWNLRYPFPGAGVRVTDPIDANARHPKEWGTCGSMGAATDIFVDPNAHFQTQNVQVADPFFLCHDVLEEPFASVVIQLLTENAIRLDHTSGIPGVACGVYKVGIAAAHTLQSMAILIGERALHAYTLKVGQLWSSAAFLDMNRDHTGEVYCI